VDQPGLPKKLLRVLGGEAVWPPPVWLMRQAGRYLPEYRTVRAKAGDFIALCTAPELAAEVTLQPVLRFGLDAAILFSDILMLPWALGYELRFEEGEGPVLPRFEAEALPALDLERLPGAVGPIMETIRRVRAALADGIPAALIGFAGGPFTVAAYMIEGGGSADHARTRALAYEEPDLLAALVERLTEATILYLQAQIDAGAEAAMLFESWAGLLSPPLFRAHVTEPTRRIAAALKAHAPSVPVIGFPRSAGMMLGGFATETGVDAIGLDWTVDPLLAAAVVPERTALQGNLDPVALRVGGAALAQETTAILAALQGRPHVFNLGHGILPDTPPEHVAELVRLVQAA
jgi:uroporphyrinogen decarboxylase